MTTLKKELKELIDREDNMGRLKEVKTILTGQPSNPAGKEYIMQSALKGKEAIKGGRVPPRGEAFARKDPSKMKG